MTNTQKASIWEKEILVELVKLRKEKLDSLPLTGKYFDSNKTDVHTEKLVRPEHKIPTCSVKGNALKKLQLLDGELDSIMNELDYLNQTLSSISIRWPHTDFCKKVIKDKKNLLEEQESLLVSSMEYINQNKNIISGWKQRIAQQIECYNCGSDNNVSLRSDNTTL